MKFTRFCLMTGLCALSTGSALADNWCRPSAAPRVNIKTSTDHISYDFTQSEKQLNAADISTVSPYGKDVITDVGGLMKGGIETQQQMSFKTITNYQTNQICIFYDQIDVTLHIRPTILIAKEFPKGTCMHNSIMGHEYKHVSVDREIVNKYANLVGQGLKKELSITPILGPYPAAQQSAALEQVKMRLKTLLKSYTDAMSSERRIRQQAVDNLQEYNRVNDACKGKR